MIDNNLLDEINKTRYLIHVTSSIGEVLTAAAGTADLLGKLAGQLSRCEQKGYTVSGHTLDGCIVMVKRSWGRYEEIRIKVTLDGDGSGTDSPVKKPIEDFSVEEMVEELAKRLVWYKH